MSCQPVDAFTAIQSGFAGRWFKNTMRNVETAQDLVEAPLVTMFGVYAIDGDEVSDVVPDAVDPDLHPRDRQVHTSNARTRASGARSDLTTQEWKALVRAFRRRCVYCGEYGSTLDHVVPVDAGGATEFGNVVTACKCCNSSKGASPLEDWAIAKGLDLGHIYERIAAGYGAAGGAA